MQVFFFTLFYQAFCIIKLIIKCIQCLITKQTKSSKQYIYIYIYGMYIYGMYE